MRTRNSLSRLAVGIVGALVLSACGGASNTDSDLEVGSAAEPFTPSFVGLGGTEITVEGKTMRLSDSSVRYGEARVDLFDDRETQGHDGLSLNIRRFFDCETDDWNLGGQIFVVDHLADGIWQNDAELIEKGLIGLDFGASLPLGEDGVYSLARDCDGATIADPGETHHSTQWLVELARGIHLLIALDDPARAERIDLYTDRVEELASRLADDENAQYWEDRWLVDDEGNLFTHKTFMRAAGLQLAAWLTDDPENQQAWSREAETIARRGIEAQTSEGVNPERGGYDVRYQMYGTSLAQLYLSVLPANSELRPDLEASIDDAIEWMLTRIDPQSGVVDIGASTRTCSAIDGNAPFDPARTIHVLLQQAFANPEQADFADLAVLVDDAYPPDAGDFILRPNVKACPVD